MGCAPGWAGANYQADHLARTAGHDLVCVGARRPRNGIRPSHRSGEHRQCQREGGNRYPCDNNSAPDNAVQLSSPVRTLKLSISLIVGRRRGITKAHSTGGQVTHMVRLPHRAFFAQSLPPSTQDLLHRPGRVGRPTVARRHRDLDSSVRAGVHHHTRRCPVLSRAGHTHRAVPRKREVPPGDPEIQWSSTDRPRVDDAHAATHPGPRPRLPHRPGAATQRGPHRPQTTASRRTHCQRRRTTTLLALVVSFYPAIGFTIPIPPPVLGRPRCTVGSTGSAPRVDLALAGRRVPSALRHI